MLYSFLPSLTLFLCSNTHIFLFVPVTPAEKFLTKMDHITAQSSVQTKYMLAPSEPEITQTNQDHDCTHCNFVVDFTLKCTNHFVIVKRKASLQRLQCSYHARYLIYNALFINIIYRLFKKYIYV